MSKKITRIGKLPRGTIVHIVVEKSNRALCKKKQVGLIVDKTLTIENVTCKRCQTTPVFKKEMTKFKLLKLNAELEEKLKTEKEKEKPKAKESFYKKQQKTGAFKIIHEATKEVFFSRIDEDVIDIALKKLNAIKDKWTSKSDKIPKKYIPKCRAALALAYKNAEVPTPKDLREDEQQAKKGRSLKRRNDKKQKEVKQEKKGKSNAQKLLDFVVGEMIKGISLTNLTKKVVERFELSQKKGVGTIKKTIRRLRKKEIEMTIETRPNKNDDIYRIATD